MIRLTRDGTAEPVSREQILRANGDREKIIFPVQLTTSRIGNFTRLINAMLYYVMTIHTTAAVSFFYGECVFLPDDASDFEGIFLPLYSSDNGLDFFCQPCIM